MALGTLSNEIDGTAMHGSDLSPRYPVEENRFGLRTEVREFSYRITSRRYPGDDFRHVYHYSDDGASCPLVNTASCDEAGLLYKVEVQFDDGNTGFFNFAFFFPGE